MDPRGRGRRGRDFGGRRGRGPPGGGGGGGRGGRPESKREGREAIRRALEGLVISGEPQPRSEEERMTLAKRPDQGGRAGKRVELLVNFFAMNVGAQTVYHYDVDFRQREDPVYGGEGMASVTGTLPIKLCRALVLDCAEKHRWERKWVHDGKKNIFAVEEIFPRQKSTFPIEYESQGRTREFEIGIQWASTINLLDIRRFLERGDVIIPREALQSLEVCLRFSACNDPACHIGGRSIFFDDPTTNQHISESTELWVGYHQGVKLTQNGLAMNVETTCSAFIRKRAVVELMADSVGCRSIDDCRHMDQGMRQEMDRAVAGLIVQRPDHRSSNRKFRCKGLTDVPATHADFTLKDGTTLSVAEYWSQRYGPLRYPWLPCLDVSKGKKVTYLPPEEFEVAPGQRVKRMTEDITRSMIRFSAKPPAQRQKEIENTVSRMNINQDPAAASFRIELNRSMSRVEGRVLPQPHLEYTQPEAMDTGTGGAWNLTEVQFFRPGQIKSWAILSFVPKKVSLRDGEQGLLIFMEALMDMLHNMGIGLPRGVPPLVHREMHTTEDALRQALEDAERHYNGLKPDLVLVLLDKKESGPYREVKRIAERDLGVTTQCFVARSAGIGSPPRGRMQYLANLAMKINHKIGGVNTQIVDQIANAFPILGRSRNRPFIVFGADVTHPTTRDGNEPSVGAIVASMDPFLGQFAARVLSMPPREEKMSMHEAMVDLFREFYRRSSVTPEAVFFYRDGVSEGQFQTVLDHEYAEIRKACTILSPTYKPPITLIVVQKMHHTRLFPVRPEEGDRNGNVMPGTCVDTGITSKYEFDFYLNSHSGIQGTNKPAHYCVLVDENGFGSDGLQLFSYWMCYLYCRCTRSVSYVPPAYYAHLAALHGRYLLGPHSDSSSEGSNNHGRTTMFHEDLDQKMFFV